MGYVMFYNYFSQQSMRKVVKVRIARRDPLTGTTQNKEHGKSYIFFSYRGVEQSGSSSGS